MSSHPLLRQVPKKPLVQSGLFGFKFIYTTKRLPVRQVKKKSGSKVRSHSRKKQSGAKCSGSRPAGPPSALAKEARLGGHIDADSAKTINSILIQDKLDQCKARRLAKPKSFNK